MSKKSIERQQRETDGVMSDGAVVLEIFEKHKSSIESWQNTYTDVKEMMDFHSLFSDYIVDQYFYRSPSTYSDDTMSFCIDRTFKYIVVLSSIVHVVSWTGVRRERIFCIIIIHFGESLSLSQ